MFKLVVLLFTIAIAYATPGYPFSSYAPVLFHSSNGSPLFQQLVVSSSVQPDLEYHRPPLEGAPIEEHVIDSVPPPAQIYAESPVRKPINSRASTISRVIASTRPHIEYAPHIQNQIMANRGKSRVYESQHDW